MADAKPGNAPTEEPKNKTGSKTAKKTSRKKREGTTKQIGKLKVYTR